MSADAKIALRREARAARAAFVAAMDPRSRASAFSLPPPLIAPIARAGIVAVYYAMGDEADPGAIARFAAREGKTLCLPRIAGGRLEFRRWDLDPGALVAGPLGIHEPSGDAPILVPDLIITPLLAFDAGLARLGQGKGYYDRAFATLPHAHRVGLAWSVQQVERVPLDPWDAPLDAVLTEQIWIGPTP